MREPNLDPHSYRSIEYRHMSKTESRDEWVKTQMQDPIIINTILERAEGPYGGLREKFIWDGKTHKERQKQQQYYCRMFLERQWDLKQI